MKKLCGYGLFAGGAWLFISDHWIIGVALMCACAWLLGWSGDSASSPGSGGPAWNGDVDSGGDSGGDGGGGGD